MLRLRLAPIPDDTQGIYRIGGVEGRLPPRFRWLEPAATAAFVALEQATGGLVYTDLLRSPSESLAARRIKRGVQPPSYSAHNFGLAFDVAVEATLKLRGWSYLRLLQELLAFGFHCHRRDQKQLGESWHFNFIPDIKYLQYANLDWGRPIEERITDLYGAAFALKDHEVQEGLRKLSLYQGAIDGEFGPLTREAVRVFQRAWGLVEDGDAGVKSRRVLALVTAEREEVVP